MTVAVRLEHVHKVYRHGRAIGRRRLGADLNIPQLDIERGATVGLVGGNGAGKSTLLRIIAGVTGPTHGTVFRDVSATGLLSLGGGINGPLSGRENARTIAMLAGASRREAHELMPAIEEYAAIGPAFEDPVRTYSSGMRMRVAFAALVHVRPQLMLLDEIMSVGDRHFRTKSANSIRELSVDPDVTMVVASHEIDALEAVCDQMMWLDAGRVRAYGPTREVLNHYHAAEHHDRAAGNVRPDRTGVTPAPGQVSIESIDVVDDLGDRLEAVSAGRPFTIEARLRIDGCVADPVVYLAVLPRDVTAEQNAIDAISTAAAGVRLGELHGEVTVRARCLQWKLPGGEYCWSAAVFSDGWEDRLAGAWRVGGFDCEAAGAAEALPPLVEWTVRDRERPRATTERSPTSTAAEARTTGRDHREGEPIDVFVLSERRTGSNLLVTSLSQLHGVGGGDELFHARHFRRLAPLRRRDLLAWPRRMLAGVDEPIRVGKIQWEQLEARHLSMDDFIESQPEAVFIVLYRHDLLAQYASLLTAEQTDQWVLRDDEERAVEPGLTIDPIAFGQFCHRSNQRYDSALRTLERLEAPHAIISYEDLAAGTDGVMAWAASLLGVEPTAVRERLHRQAVQPLADRVDNWPEAAGWRDAAMASRAHLGPSRIVVSTPSSAREVG